MSMELSKMSWEKWVRWLLPLLLIWLALGMAAVIIAQAIHLGPFRRMGERESIVF
jgi:uncharacterized ion transporter superfamily protein YfcC